MSFSFIVAVFPRLPLYVRTRESKSMQGHVNRNYAVDATGNLVSMAANSSFADDSPEHMKHLASGKLAFTPSSDTSDVAGHA